MKRHGRLELGAGTLQILVAALLLIAAAALTVGAGVASAALPQASGSVDLLSQANVTVHGVNTGDSLGRAVDNAGDVNGDGRDDLIVGAPFADVYGVNSGSAFVVFGGTMSDVDVGTAGWQGFRIDGKESLDTAGAGVAGAGDVNHDGLDDVIVGAQGVDINGAVNVGAAYIVFGKTSTSTIQLGSLGSDGYRIIGAAANDAVAYGVDGGRDVNDDGTPDTILGAIYADNNGRSTSGSTYVVFGKSSTTEVDLANLGSGGYRIDGAAANDQSAIQARTVADMNGDGRAEVLTGAAFADKNGRSDSGSAYVVFGKADTTNIDLAALGSNGYRIDGAVANDTFSYGLGDASDVNGDGTPDVVIGAHTADNNGRTNSGSAYVVFGKSSTGTIDTAALGSYGFRIDGAAAGDGTGVSPAGTGDVNGDGLADVLIGSWATDNLGRNQAGSSVVIFGRSETGTIDLASLGNQGFIMNGAGANNSAGFNVSGLGDFNGDGRPDVVTGAVSAPTVNRGSAYIVYGFGPPELSYDPSSLTHPVGTQIAPMTPIVKRTGTASFSVDPPLPPGLSIDPSTGVVSGTLTNAQPATTHTVTMTDLVGSVSAELSFTVTDTVVPDTSGPCARLMSGPTLYSVSPWKKLPGAGRARLRGPVGGLVLTSSRAASFSVQTKQMRGPRIKQVSFMLDGSQFAVDRRAPFSASIGIGQLKRGVRSLKVVVRRSKARKALTHKIFVTNCRPTKFSAAMSTKKRNASPTLKLTAQTYGPELSTASFKLPRALGVRVGSRLRGKSIGTLSLGFQDGRRSSQKLKLPAGRARTLALLSAAGTEVKLAKRRLSVSGLPPNVARLSIILQGKRAGLLKNPRRCSRLTYGASLSDRTNASLKLQSGTRIC